MPAQALSSSLPVGALRGETLGAGLSFKPQHVDEALAARAAGLWFEVHPENYMVAGGPRLAMLDALRRDHPLSLHGVALSLAGPDEPDAAHLKRFADLVARWEPTLVSEHLAWSRMGEVYFPDLLPVPRDRDSLVTLCANIERTQEVLGRSIALENPSHYLPLAGHTWGEVDFLCEVAKRTGCGLLIDVNNVYVGANNLGYDAAAWLDAIPGALVQEVHLAGHSPDPALGAALLIDSHDAPVAEPVWALWQRLIHRIGPRPTLIERDENLPAFAALFAERSRAQAALA